MLQLSVHYSGFFVFVCLFGFLLVIKFHQQNAQKCIPVLEVGVPFLQIAAKIWKNKIKKNCPHFVQFHTQWPPLFGSAHHDPLFCKEVVTDSPLIWCISVSVTFICEWLPPPRLLLLYLFFCRPFSLHKFIYSKPPCTTETQYMNAV